MATRSEANPEARCLRPGPDDLECWRMPGHEGPHEALVEVCGVDCDVTWDYASPARWWMPEALAEGLDALGDTLRAIGFEWYVRYEL